MEIIKKDLINRYSNLSSYETFFKCSNEEITKILKYQLFLREKKSNNFSEDKSHFWDEIVSSRFVGVSDKYLMVKSGSRFSTSPFVTNHFDTRFDNNLFVKIKWLFRNLKVFYNYFNRWNTENISLKKEIKRLKSIYGEIVMPKNHDDFMNYFPIRYIDHLEIIQLINSNHIERYLEIGPGNCINVALQLSIRKIKKVFLIDLPQSIIFGYCFLNIFFKGKFKIGLPNEVNKENIDEFDIVFLLPDQTDLIRDNNIDIAMNVSSFQEMNLETVNNYINLLEKKLKINGQLISVNQIKAFYIPNNNLENWKLSKFNVEKHDLRFINNRNLTLMNKNFKQVLLNCILKN